MKSLQLLIAALVLGSCASQPIVDVPPPPPPTVDLSVPPLEDTLAGLLVGLGIEKPVVISRENLIEHNLLGQSRDMGLWYVIAVDPRLTDLEQTMVLVHEVAHVVVWDRGLLDSHHTIDWGQVYAESFRLWVGEDSPPILGPPR